MIGKNDRPVVEWKSPWRIEFERRTAEDKLKARLQKRHAPKPVFRAKAEPTKRIRINPETARFCACGKWIRQNNKTGLCIKCYDTKTLCPCGRRIHLDNEHRLCRFCYPKTHIPVCNVEGCDNVIDKRNRSGMCRTHYDSNRTAIVVESERVNCKAEGCIQKLNANNRCGLCKRHYNLQRRRLNQEEHSCVDCGKRIKSNTKWGRCKKCAIPYNSRAWTEKKRMKREEERARRGAETNNAVSASN